MTELTRVDNPLGINASTGANGRTQSSSGHGRSGDPVWDAIQQRQKELVAFSRGYKERKGDPVEHLAQLLGASDGDDPLLSEDDRD